MKYPPNKNLSSNFIFARFKTTPILFPPILFAAFTLIFVLVFILSFGFISQGRSVAYCQERCNQKWIAPVNDEIFKYSNIPEQDWKPGHRGVDYLVSLNQEIIAPESGYISYKGSTGGIPTIVVTHDGASKLRSTFLPVKSDLSLSETVTQGQVIGKIVNDNSHCAESNSESTSEIAVGTENELTNGLESGNYCLHWGIKLGDSYLRPESKLFGEVVLLE